MYYQYFPKLCLVKSYFRLWQPDCKLMNISLGKADIGVWQCTDPNLWGFFSTMLG